MERAVYPDSPRKKGRKPALFTKKGGERVFLAVAATPNLSALLESIFTVHLLKKKNRNVVAEILVHPEGKRLAEGSALFDQIHVCSADAPLKQLLSKLSYDILYVPEKSLKQKISPFFNTLKMKIGGERMRLVSWLLNHYGNRSTEDLERLKLKGLDLIPEACELEFDLGELSTPYQRTEEQVWLSVFDPHNLTAAYPIGHIARLIRLLDSIQKKGVVPIYSDTPKEKIDELKQLAPSVLFLENPTIDRRIEGMLQSEIVIGPAGAETLLAGFLGKKVVELHDMRSKNLHAESVFGQQSSADLWSSRYASFFRAAEAVKRNLMPPTFTCAGECKTCQYDSCLEYISPERVFESIKKLLFPF